MRTSKMHGFLWMCQAKKFLCADYRSRPFPQALLQQVNNRSLSLV